MPQPGANQPVLKFSFLKSICIHFKTPARQVLVLFGTRLAKNLIWQKLSAVCESNFQVSKQTNIKILLIKKQ